jgi:hypothetical protein
MNVTLPVGVPGPLEPTVAVKVTAWPNVEGLADVVTEVVVDDLLTTWLTDGEVLPVKFVSPP